MPVSASSSSVCVALALGDIEAVFERAATGFAVYTADGVEVRRTRRFTELLGAHADRAELTEAVGTLLGGGARGSGSGGRPATALCLTTGTARYELSAVFCATDGYASDALTFITIRLLGASLPTVGQLGESFGLSARQAQVALLLCTGASNKGISAELGIRPATVRTHAQQIFLKLGVHSRKALGLSLSSGSPQTLPQAHRSIGAG